MLHRSVYFSNFYIKKQAFYSPSALYHEEDIKDRHETFIYSSLWSSRQRKGFRLHTMRESFCQILLLLCGYVETCPGPAVRCGSCNKSVKKSQSQISCPLCQKYFHLRCFGSTEEGSCCFCSQYKESGQECKQEQTQTMEDFQQ